MDIDSTKSVQDAQEIVADAGDDVVRYGVRVGTLKLLLPLQTLNEVVDEVSVYPVPNTPVWFEGVINHRGNIVSVFNLKILFFGKERCFDEGGQESESILVIGKGDGATGVLVDHLPQTVSVDEMESGFSLKVSDVLKKHVTAHTATGWLEVDFPGLFEEIGRMVLL